MDTINHPLTSMQAVRQYEEEIRRQRSAAYSSLTSSSPSHLPRSRSNNSSFSSSSPSLAETECSAISSSSSTVPSDKKAGGLLHEHRRSSSAHSRGTGSISTQSSFHTAQQEHLLNDEADESQMSSGGNPSSTPTRPQAVTLKRTGSDLSSQLSAPLERISTPDRRWLEEFIDNDDESLLTFTTHTKYTYGDENEENPPQAAARNYPASPQRSILSAGSTLFGLDVLSTTQSTLTTASSDANGIPPPPPPPASSTPTPQKSTTLDSDFLIPQQQPKKTALATFESSWRRPARHRDG